ncbi:MAG: DUF559 domain-containing protein [Methylococcales bacterium]|nr:DUF559 domain-containing protein [Methylococcales bacterium]
MSGKSINNDTERTKVLNQRGFKVIRFWNNELFDNLDAVLESIRLDVEKQKLVLK